MSYERTRREVLAGLGAAASGFGSARRMVAAPAPAAPVAVAKCREYGREVLPALTGMFDQLGGLGRLVRGKTVAIKLNVNALPTLRVGHLPAEVTFWPHPDVIAATMHLMAKAGAHRILLLESTQSSNTEPLQEHLIMANWDLSQLTGAHPRVEFDNTNTLGNAKHYVRFPVPGGGLVYPAYDLSHAYRDCDVMVSIAKLKDHPTTGVTLGMKNMFGITPRPAYNDRMKVLHAGAKPPDMGAPPEKDPSSPRDDGYRLPHILADLALARPVHLSILDGVTGLSGAQRPAPGASQVKPGVLLAGTNIANVDAAAVAVMSYDPQADRGVLPFMTCDNFLRVAEQAGVGTRDFSRIEILGTPIREAVFDFRTLRERFEKSRARQTPA